MEDGRVEDQDITATDHHTESSSAHYSRLNSNKGAGAWCHSSIDKDDSEQYLQVGVLHFYTRSKVVRFYVSLYLFNQCRVCVIDSEYIDIDTVFYDRAHTYF